MRAAGSSANSGAPHSGFARARHQLVEDGAAVLQCCWCGAVVVAPLPHKVREHRLTTSNPAVLLQTCIHTCRQGKEQHPRASAPKSAELKADPAPALKRGRGKENVSFQNSNTSPTAPSVPRSRELQEVRRHLRHLQDSSPGSGSQKRHSTGQIHSTRLPRRRHKCTPQNAPCASVVSHICRL